MSSSLDSKTFMSLFDGEIEHFLMGRKLNLFKAFRTLKRDYLVFPVDP